MERIDLPGAVLELEPGFAPAGERARLFEDLLATIPWETHVIRLFGREIASPRLSCWIGDPQAVYVYSGATFVPRPWTTALADWRVRIEHATGAAYDSVLANLYRDGRDGMGFHADDEPELGPEPVIASLSLGAERRFVLKHRRTGTRHELVLGDGDLLVMRGPTQQHWKHALPKTARTVGPRINLTYRQVTALSHRERGRGRETPLSHRERGRG